MEREESFPQMVLGTLDIYTQRMKLDPYPTLYTKVNLKWVKQPKCEAEIIKLIEENTG